VAITAPTTQIPEHQDGLPKVSGQKAVVVKMPVRSCWRPLAPQR